MYIHVLPTLHNSSTAQPAARLTRKLTVSGSVGQTERKGGVKDTKHDLRSETEFGRALLYRTCIFRRASKKKSIISYVSFVTSVRPSARLLEINRTQNIRPISIQLCTVGDT